MLCPKEIANAIRKWKALLHTNNAIKRVIIVDNIFPILHLTAVYLACKLWGGGSVSVYCINSHTIFSPKLKSNFIYLGNFSSIWQEFLPFLLGWITLYIYAL